jgi:hypothetical protein
MRVSLWQQFSSNHSASFTVVGKFESSEKAEAVADELRHILQIISNYWQQYANKQRTTIENRLIESEQLTPPEVVFRDQYQVGWTEYFGTGKMLPLDWVHGDWALDGVRVFRNIVYLSPTGDTWAGPKPFNLILEKLGGHIAVWEEVGEGALVVSIRFTAPSQAIADAVDRGIIRYKDSGIWFLKLSVFENKTAGQFRRENLEMELRDVYLSWAGLDFDDLINFQKIVAFIEKNNCTVSDYEFNIIPYPDE